jgi:hypothetical protein
LIAVPSVKKNRDSRHSGGSRLQSNIPIKGKWPILKCIALSLKIFFTLKVFLQDFLIAQLPKITKEGVQEAECLEEEAKVSLLL